MPAERPTICAVVLAGGAGTRMGGVDKGWVAWRGRALVEHVLDVLQPQVDGIAISANRNVERYAALGWPVWPDDRPGHVGPLAGIATALRRAAEPLLLTVPVDSPDPPTDLAARLARVLDKQARAAVAVAHDGVQRQPLFALWRRGCLDIVLARLAAGELAVHRVQDAVVAVEVDCRDVAARFRNLNTPRDTDGDAPR